MFIPSNQPEPLYFNPSVVGVLVANYGNVSDVYLASNAGVLAQVDANGVPINTNRVLLAKAGTAPLQYPTFKGVVWARAATAPGADISVVPNETQ